MSKVTGTFLWPGRKHPEQGGRCEDHPLKGCCKKKQTREEEVDLAARCTRDKNGDYEV